MTAEQIWQVHHATPFRPFTIHLTDGRAFTVNHPEFMMIMPGRRTIVVAVSDDAAEIIDVMLVTSLTTGNGSQAA
ncbi:MAG: hypothetical protein HY360_13120 [Verrucomicrobia bacterium]|nr:hypothetical protein [Verrucomicrobiota bacterium]